MGNKTVSIKVSVSQASAITLGDIKGYMTGKYDTAYDTHMYQ